jgi:hypothetical protein
VIPKEAIETVAGSIDAAARSVSDALSAHQVQTEDDFTSRMLDRIEVVVDKRRTGGFSWKAMKLTDRGQRSQESEYGADLLGALSVKTASTSFAKGFLAQAKLVGVGRSLKLARLREQCEDMLKHTPDSFVFFYDATHVTVVSALVVARSREHPSRLPHWSLREFFIAHLSSFVGDEHLGAASPESLDTLRSQYEARNALRIEATQQMPRHRPVET